MANDFAKKEKQIEKELIQWLAVGDWTTMASINCIQGESVVFGRVVLFWRVLWRPGEQCGNEPQ